MDKFFKYILTLCILLVASLQFIQVLFRYVFNTPVILVEEIIIFPMVWLYFLGCISAAREGSQISADVITSFMKNKRKILVIKSIAQFISTLLSGWLAYWAYDYFLYSIRVWKTTPYGSIPLFYAEVAVFVGFIFITLYTFLGMIKYIREYKLQPVQ